MISDRCAVGFRVHSGWAAAVIVGGTIRRPLILDRRNVVLVPSDAEEFTQPYHVASEVGAQAGRRVIARAEHSAEQLAMAAIRDLVKVAPAGLCACAILTSKAKIPSDLESVLQSHALVHGAEGELFRSALAKAAVTYAFEVDRFLEQDVSAELASLTISLGPPWTKDEKLASLAALFSLEQRALVSA